MSKAEEKAQTAYPTWRNGIGDEFSSNSAYYGFIEGYHQAEKDLKLSWVDMFRIDEITSQVFKDSYTCQMEVIYQEVLKRFEDYRERKENG